MASYLIPGLELGRRLATVVNLLLLLSTLVYLLAEPQREVVQAFAQFNLANWTFAYCVRKFSVYKDLALKTQLEREALTHLANTDELTGLANRLYFRDKLEASLRCPRRTRFAVVFIDLDRFKAVNDSHGHAVGDELLIAVASRLRNSVRSDDTLARLSGDEFVVLLKNVPSAEDAARIVQSMLARFQEPFRLSSGVVPLSASIGFSVFPDDGESAPALLQEADRAMYQVKARGRVNPMDFADAVA